jgi:DNA polymerase III subunit alpha
VNVSGRDFTPVYERAEGTKARRHGGTKGRTEGTIRFGLCAIRGVGEKAVEAIIEERGNKGGFAGLHDFCERIDSRQVNRATVEALVKCGAFASTGARRAQLLHVLDAAIETGQQAQQDRRMGQMNMFAGPDSSGSSRQPPSLPDVKELSNTELLKFEKELLGFYISSHPLTEHQSAVERYSTASTSEAMDLHEGAEVTIGGMFGQVRTRVAKSGRSAGQKWAIITLEDLEGKIEGMVFAEAFSQFGELVTPEQIVVVRAKVDRKRETPCLVINDIMPLEQATAKLTTALVLKLEGARHAPSAMTELKPILGRHKGNVPVFVQVAHNGIQSVLIRLGGDYGIRASRDMVGDIETLLGAGTAELCGPGTKRQRRRAQQQLFSEEPEAASQDVDTGIEEIDPTDN